MTEGLGQKSVVQQIEEQSGEQRQLAVVEAIARTGERDPEAIAEYLSEFKATGQLAENQQEFLLRIKAIRQNMELTDPERLEAGREAAEQARDRHAELSRELARQADKRLTAATKTLFGGADSLTLNALADLDAKQLDTRAEIARTSGDMDLMRAVRAVAAAKGFEDLVTKASALDEDDDISVAYQERQKLRSDSGLRAVSNAYAPPPVGEQQLRPSSGDVERARHVKASQDASARRVMSGRPGITDR